jgi:hypothetical protein
VLPHKSILGNLFICRSKPHNNEYSLTEPFHNCTFASFSKDRGSRMFQNVPEGGTETDTKNITCILKDGSMNCATNVKIMIIDKHSSGENVILTFSKKLRVNSRSSMT